MDFTILIFGFLLIVGTRVAGGSASGQKLPGAMQMSINSLLFSKFTFTRFFATGKYFYKNRKKRILIKNKLSIK